MAKRTGKKIVPVPSNGYCYVHEQLINRYQTEKAKGEHPDAELLVHPEVSPEIQEIADYIGSASQILREIGESRRSKFLLGTEEGFSYRATRLYPNKDIHPVNPKAVCADMKKITMLSIIKSLETLEPKVIIKKKVEEKSRNILEKSLEMMK